MIFLISIVVGLSLSHGVNHKQSLQDDLSHINELLNKNKCYANPLQYFTLHISIDHQENELVITENHYKLSASEPHELIVARISINNLNGNIEPFLSRDKKYIYLKYTCPNMSSCGIRTNIINGKERAKTYSDVISIGNWEIVHSEFVQKEIYEAIVNLFNNIASGGTSEY